MRRQGLIPGVLYGHGEAAHAISVEERELRRALTGTGGLHAILDVVLDGGRPRPAVLKDYQQDPMRGHVTHVDLQEVRLDELIQSQVVVALVGEAVGAKEGGVLSQVTREITVEALPMDVPEHIDVDVSGLHIGEAVRVADLPPNDAVTYLDDPDTVLATVTHPTRIEVPEEMAEIDEEVTGVPTGGEASEKASESAIEPEADAAGSPGTVRG